ncbi:hypothetical protein AMECASPLE_037534 [Ameca splendens]|uniref:Uncharacterized protein n=1 Tax=Ameca splendens TaxID=208324 RepID=A0ABV0Z810_9TELE
MRNPQRTQLGDWLWQRRRKVFKKTKRIKHKVIVIKLEHSVPLAVKTVVMLMLLRKVNVRLLGSSAMHAKSGITLKNVQVQAAYSEYKKIQKKCSSHRARPS